MVQLPLAALPGPATNPCSWLFGLSVGCLSDTYSSALIIDDDAIGTIGEDKCNSQLEMLQKCKKCPLVAKRRGGMVVTPKKMRLPAARYCQGRRKVMKMASTLDYIITVR